MNVDAHFRHLFDAVILGGGPAGLSAALALGRARRRVLLADAGPRRNAAAARMYNFVTRDGTPPDQFRRAAREELATYASVEVRDVAIEAITGERGAFSVRLADGTVGARRILLAGGMVDVLPELEGLSAFWGGSIFQCPYCHGWEHRDERFGVLAPTVEMLEMGLLLRAWTGDVVVFTDGKFPVPDDVRARLASGAVRLDERRLVRLTGADGRLEAAHVEDGTAIPLDVLIARPTQTQVPVVEALGLKLNPMGFVEVHEMFRETSRPGIYAAGDLATPMQGAIMAAASGTAAAAMLNHFLTPELAIAGQL